MVKDVEISSNWDDKNDKTVEKSPSLKKSTKTTKKCRYCKKTYNNARTTYFALAVKLLAPFLFNIEKLAQNKEAEIKPTVGGSFSHFQWYSVLILSDSSVQA